MNAAIEMAKRLVVDSIWKSANLEGLGTTFPQTEMILNNLPVETSREEVLFVVNMKRAWQFLLDNLEYRNCLMLLREFNKVVGDNLIYGAGEIRTLEVSIGGASWKPEIPDQADIYNKINAIEGIENPELKALKYFCFVARTQMFIDGNKRVAQLIANKVLIENGVGIFQVPIDAIESFTLLLISYYETGDDTDIIRFMQDYCVNRVSGGQKIFVKNVEEVTSFEEVKDTRRFVMSRSQIGVVNSVLKNIRNLLSSYELTGTWELYEEYGDIVLSSEYGYCVIHGENSTVGGKLEGKSPSILKEFIEKTVILLTEKVPFSVKRIVFSVSNRKLVAGKITDSESEKGSIEIHLV